MLIGTNNGLFIYEYLKNQIKKVTFQMLNEMQVLQIVHDKGDLYLIACRNKDGYYIYQVDVIEETQVLVYQFNCLIDTQFLKLIKLNDSLII